MPDHTTAVWQDNRSTHYRQGRRRWVPKGVMLLAVLFVFGLLSACQMPSVPVAAIAVPSESLAECAAPESVAYHYRDWKESSFGKEVEVLERYAASTRVYPDEFRALRVAHRSMF